MRHLRNIAAIVAMATLFLAPASVLAGDTAEQLCEGAGGNWSGSSCSTPGDDVTVTGTFQAVANILLYILGAIAVIMIIIGGIRYATSSGDQSQVSGAKNTILYAIIGLIVAILAYAIVNFVLAQLT